MGRPVAHSFLGLHPWPSRLTPSWTVEQAHLDAQPTGCFQCRTQILPPQAALKFVFAESLPLPRIIPCRLVANVGGKECQGNAVLLHPLQVGHNTFRIHLLVHPIIVASYADAVGRCEKRLPEAFARVIICCLCMDYQSESEHSHKQQVAFLQKLYFAIFHKFRFIVLL